MLPVTKQCCSASTPCKTKGKSGNTKLYRLTNAYQTSEASGTNHYNISTEVAGSCLPLRSFSLNSETRIIDYPGGACSTTRGLERRCGVKTEERGGNPKQVLQRAPTKSEDKARQLVLTEMDTRPLMERLMGNLGRAVQRRSRQLS